MISVLLLLMTAVGLLVGLMLGAVMEGGTIGLILGTPLLIVAVLMYLKVIYLFVLELKKMR